ncbi:AMP-binding protein [Prosthecobacter sp.]
MEPEFWSDGSVWIGESEHTPEGASLAEFAQHELKVKDACFFKTSGSEGRPKWVGLTKQALLTSAAAVNAHFHITAQDHWLLALPTHHVGGFGILARAHLSGSAVTRLEGKWNAMAFVDACATARATLASLVPTQVFDIVTARLACPPSMRVVLVGGGALSAEIAQAAQHLGWPVCRTYGMTETASQVASQARDGDDMEVLPLWALSTDADGVLTIRGAALAQGYAMQEGGQWTWQPIPPAAGLRTRDRVELWSDGHKRLLRFLAREAGIVKILGELVALGPIQERIDSLRLQLRLLEGDAAVCDVPDARKEHALMLVVSSMSEADATRLQSALNAKLRPLEHINEIRPVTSIPRSELGKVRLAALRAML